MCLDGYVYTGRLKVMLRGGVVAVRIEDPEDGKLFAECPVIENGKQSSKKS